MRTCTLFATSLTLLASAARAGTLTVTSVNPDLNGLNAAVDTPIVVHFDRPVLPSSVTSSSFRVFGRWSSAAEGKFTFSNNDQTVTLTPDAPFSAGETVMVMLSHDLTAQDGSPLRAAGFSFHFWTVTRPACLNFNELDVMSNRTTPEQQTRIY